MQFATSEDIKFEVAETELDGIYVLENLHGAFNFKLLRELDKPTIKYTHDYSHEYSHSTNWQDDLPQCRSGIKLKPQDLPHVNERIYLGSEGKYTSEEFEDEGYFDRHGTFHYWIDEINEGQTDDIPRLGNGDIDFDSCTEEQYYRALKWQEQTLAF
jgi:hypothetical protein